MLRLIKILGDAMVFILLLSACGAPSPPPSNSTGPVSPRKLSEQDDGGTVTLGIGEQLDITLAANPTTGYQWEVASGDSAVLKQVGEPVYTADSAALGSGGTMTFHFVALAPGQTTLKLVYHRPFEKDTPPVQTFEITAVVK